MTLALLFLFLLINDIRMTTFTHQLLSRKRQRQTSDNASENIPAAMLRCPSLYCAWAMQK